MMDRRFFIATSAAAFATATLAPARAATQITTQLQWIKDVQNAAWWVADAKGYFRDEGLESNALAGGPNLSSVEAVVAAGRADVGFDQLEKIIDANNAGEDFVIFGALYQKNPAALLSLRAHPVRTARDILGKRIGLQQGAHIYIDAIMRVNHLPPNYTEVVVGFDPQPLVEGACDAYLCFITNQPFMLAQRNIPSVTATFDELGYETYTDCLFCTRDYLTTNRDTLVRYVRALQRGWATNARDPALAAHLAATVYGASLGLDEKHQLAVNRAQIPLMESAGTRAHGRMWIDTHRISGPIYTTLRATGRTKLPPVAQLVDLSILRDAVRPQKAS
jgi:ABC-type nitrate/sulfonate/bicarbonate transport system substrate-binding protein